MTRFFLSLLVAATLPVFAQTTRLSTQIDPAQTILGPGDVTKLRTYISDDGELTATDLRIRYEISGDATIEQIDSFDGWECALAGNTAECTKPSIWAHLTNVLIVTVRAGNENGDTATVTMTATSGPLTAPVASSVSRTTLQLYHALVVDTVADSGAGSLRAAIEEANSIGKPAKIVFHLPPPVPAEGWFTLIPASPLPPITGARVFVDGKSQTRFTGDTNTRGPEIAIDGRLAHRGLEIHSRCLARVEGLVLGNFDSNQGLWFTKDGRCETTNFYTDHREVADNYIGTDPTGTVAWPNLRGLRGDFGGGTISNNLISGNTYSGMWIWTAFDEYESFTIRNNRVGTAADGIMPLPNGAAGILFGDRVAADVRENIIANHPGMGIALVRGETYVSIRGNSMHDNGGIGIDWGIDGVSPYRDDAQWTDPSAPVLFSARYDAESNRTYVTISIDTQRPPGPNGFAIGLDLYANRASDGDGEESLPILGGPVGSPGISEIWIPGDYRGKWINAAVTRIPQFFLRSPRISGEFVTFGDESTSELSNAILVPN